MKSKLKRTEREKFIIQLFSKILEKERKKYEELELKYKKLVETITNIYKENIEYK